MHVTMPEGTKALCDITQISEQLQIIIYDALQHMYCSPPTQKKIPCFRWVKKTKLCMKLDLQQDQSESFTKAPRIQPLNVYHNYRDPCLNGSRSNGADIVAARKWWERTGQNKHSTVFEERSWGLGSSLGKICIN